MKILVAYASDQGSTKEIAERIAVRIPSSVGETVCQPLDKLEQANGYDAVVIGSAVHNGKWLPEASDFIHRGSEELAEQPLWTFSVGTTDALPRLFRKKAMVLEETQVADAISHDIHPIGHKLFSGVLQAELVPTIPRTILRVFGGRFGDLRDWTAIDGWADEIVLQLQGSTSPTSTSDAPVSA
jgi:menaquinone-dependent protoporphyrinogen oxidase